MYMEFHKVLIKLFHCYQLLATGNNAAKVQIALYCRVIVLLVD
jgi:hypothetical protein